nr:MAG TPA: hypothetical protein [Caudoviricetes sp.]DAQ02935.1 MAG TPA: hypothetical protein [Caudoviricetes sp.]
MTSREHLRKCIRHTPAPTPGRAGGPLPYNGRPRNFQNFRLLSTFVDTLLP